LLKDYLVKRPKLSILTHRRLIRFVFARKTDTMLEIERKRESERERE
jgi:hypothetical protein